MSDEYESTGDLIVRSFAELASPDDRTAHFTPFGFGLMRPEAAAEYQQRVIASANLVARVPEDTRRAYERLRTVYAHGILCYEIFTVVHDQAPLILELALGERLLDMYEGTVPLYKGDADLSLSANRFDTVRMALRGSRYRNCALRLSSGSSMKNFRGYLPDLFDWARAEGLLHGQRNRLLERLLVDLRNDVAHPSGDHLVGPPDVSRLIWDVAEIINRIWGSRTPGGRLYPAPIGRDVYAIAWDEIGEAGVTWGRAETLADPVSSWPGEHRYVLVRAVDRDNLGEYSSTFEATAYPCDYLWGPGDREAATAWYQRAAPNPDVVDYLDRWFVVRHDEGRPESVLRPETFLAIPAGSRQGTWHLIQADFPNDAFAHRLHDFARGTLALRPCLDCHATVGPSGGWGTIARAMMELVPSAKAESVPAVDIGILWRTASVPDR